MHNAYTLLPATVLDYARHAVRGWRTSPPFAGLADRLHDGAVMEDALFPLLTPR